MKAGATSIRCRSRPTTLPSSLRQKRLGGHSGERVGSSGLVAYGLVSFDMETVSKSSLGPSLAFSNSPPACRRSLRPRVNALRRTSSTRATTGIHDTFLLTVNIQLTSPTRALIHENPPYGRIVRTSIINSNVARHALHNTQQPYRYTFLHCTMQHNTVDARNPKKETKENEPTVSFCHLLLQACKYFVQQAPSPSPQSPSQSQWPPTACICPSISA